MIKINQYFLIGELYRYFSLQFQDDYIKYLKWNLDVYSL